MSSRAYAHNDVFEPTFSKRSPNKKNGIARDIVAEADSGYDEIVIGRRGISGIKELFMGSISQKVLNLAKEASVSIVN